MSFVAPMFLWGLLLVPLLVWLLVRLSRKRSQASRYADTHLLPQVVQQAGLAKVRWPLGLQFLALTLLLFSASRPIGTLPLPTNKAVVVLAIDTSRSMLAEDLNPSRLETAKALVRRFVSLAPATTQIGLVSFSDNASALVLPSTDRQNILEALDRVKASQNTSIASAVITGRQNQKPLPDSSPSSKTDFVPGSLVVLSDGASNVDGQNPLAAAAGFAKENKVKIYTFPLGKEGGSVAQIDGQNYFIPFEPKNLERLAQDTGGKNTFPPTDESLKNIIRELGSVIRWEPTQTEIAALLSGIALILLIVAAGISLQWQRRVP
jgi:Ca-activated chloride channel homolog